MKTCPNGAIVNRDELIVMAGALDVALEAINGYIDSESPHGRRSTPTERVSLTALKESRKIYSQLAKRVHAAQKRCS